MPEIWLWTAPYGSFWRGRHGRASRIQSLTSQNAHVEVVGSQGRSNVNVASRCIAAKFVRRSRSSYTALHGELRHCFFCYRELQDAHYWRLSALYLSHYYSYLGIMKCTYETMSPISYRLLIAADHVPHGRQGEPSYLWVHLTPLYRGFYRDDPVQKAI
jgi:hypothetical protein